LKATVNRLYKTHFSTTPLLERQKRL